MVWCLDLTSSNFPHKNFQPQNISPVVYTYSTVNINRRVIACPRSITASQLQSELDSLQKLNVNTTLIDVQRNYEELEKLISQQDIVVR